MYILLLLFFAVPLGCAPYHGELPAELDSIPEQYIHLSEEIRDKGPQQKLERWWEYFAAHEMNELLETAFRQNLGLQRLFSRIERQEATARVAGGLLWPQISFLGSADRSRINFRAFRITASNFELSLPASYEVDLWRRIKSEKEAEETEFSATIEDYRAAAMSVAAQLVDHYFLISELCEQLNLLEQTVKSDESFYQLINARYRDGQAAALDVHQARQKLAGSLARRPDLDAELEKAKNSIMILAGEYPKAQLSCEARKLPRGMPVFPVGIPSELLSRRPDIRASLLRLQAQDFRIAQAVAARFPSLTLATSGAYAGPELNEVIRPESLIWRIAAEFGLTLIDGGRKRAQVDVQKAVHGELVATYYETVLQAFREVEDALVGVKRKQELVELLEEKVAAVENTLRVSMSEYLQGLRDYLPVLAAQVDYYSTQRELLSARRQLISAHVQLARALGGGWSNEAMPGGRVSRFVRARNEDQ